MMYYIALNFGWEKVHEVWQVSYLNLTMGLNHFLFSKYYGFVVSFSLQNFRFSAVHSLSNNLPLTIFSPISQFD